MITIYPTSFLIGFFFLIFVCIFIETITEKENVAKFVKWSLISLVLAFIYWGWGASGVIMTCLFIGLIFYDLDDRIVDFIKNKFKGKNPFYVIFLPMLLISVFYILISII